MTSVKAIFYSIKWRLLLICLWLVTVPTVFMGIQAYDIFQKQTFTNTEKNLKNIASDWFNTTKAYVLEEDRVLKREEALYKKQLDSITLGSQSILTFVAGQQSANLQSALRKISETKFGKSGSVMVFSSRGDILVLDNNLVTGQNFSSSGNAKFFTDSVKQLTALKDKETLVLDYDWVGADSQGARQKVGAFTYYRPLDLIIAANAYITDFKSQDLEAKLKSELKDLMGAQKIGENGYIWAINSQGDYIVSKDQYRNGENIRGVKDQNDRLVIQEIIGNTKELPAGESYIRYYPWQNVGEKQAAQTVSATTYVPEWDWIIGVSAYQDDFQQGLGLIKRQVILTVISMLVLGAAVAYLFASRIARPIQKLEGIASKVAGGQLDQDIGQDLTSKQGEVGNLARAFRLMVSRLREKIHEITVEKAGVEQKARELALAKAKDDAILDSIGEGMIVTDGAGFVLLINALAAELLGIPQEKAVGSKIIDQDVYDGFGTLLPPPKRPLSIALFSGQKISQAVQTIKSDGTKRTLFVTATPVVEHNKTIGAIQIIRDITKEKEIDRMKTEFISIASHQLRTPLSAIRWFAEMLINGDAGKLQPEQAEFAQNVLDSTERMIDLVNSLLNISRIESGRIIVDPKPTDISVLVQGIINDLKGKTEERQQTLVVSVHKELPKINLDPRLIGQVYLNLLTNAIKYTPKGGEISVIVSRKGQDVVSQVTDNGYGIPKAQQGKMFQKFFRASNVAKVETDGTGLGMYLVKSIIESSGGKIWFESEEGKGTTFWFSMPMSGMQPKAGEVTID